MTKQQFQKELKEKIKPGTKPSDLKKLKRSKSADDIPTTPPLPLLTDQLTQKQKELENLRKKLENQTQQLNSLKTNHSNLLDTNLTFKHQALKDWFSQYEKTQQLESELKENIDYASEELIAQDKTISQLRTENFKLKLTNQSLTKDLNLATKLAELRKGSWEETPPNPNSFHLALYILLTVVFSWWLMKSSNQN